MGPMIALRSPRSLSWVAALLAISAIAACSVDDARQSDPGYATEAEACNECQAILVECTSTSTNEAQFVECRDQWQACQQDRGLGQDACGNPNDIQACDMCRDRFSDCQSKGDADGICQQQFSVCKAFLIKRSDVEAQCTDSEPNAPLPLSCDICHDDLALCLSDPTEPDAAQICSDKLGQCEAAHELAAGDCGLPTSDEGCALCQQQRDGCVAAGGTTCDEGFAACSAVLAAGATCELNGGQGGGGQGGGGQGGGGQGSTCSHDECSLGEPLDATCSPCATAVCAEDSWCCDNDWDSLCLEIAQGAEECGC